jgi:glutathione S-transferase
MTTARPAQPILLHRHPLSGHAHRAQLFLSILGLPFTLADVDLLKGAHKKPEFLALNAFGQVPVLDDGGTIVADSNAILVYLALKYGDATWLPTDPAGAAAVQRWLSVAAGPIAFGPAAARLVTVFGAKLDAAEVIGRAHALLRVMNGALDRARFLTSDHPHHRGHRLLHVRRARPRGQRRPGRIPPREELARPHRGPPRLRPHAGNEGRPRTLTPRRGAESSPRELVSRRRGSSG